METNVLETAFKMTVALGAVLLVFGGAVLLAKKFAWSSKSILRSGKKSVKPLEVLAYQSLGPARGIYLVRCLDKKLLVGATNQHISHLGDVYEEGDSIAPDAFSASMQGPVLGADSVEASEKPKSSVVAKIQKFMTSNEAPRV
jgi:flagellar biogenesis protein FliO